MRSRPHGFRPGAHRVSIQSRCSEPIERGFVPDGLRRAFVGLSIDATREFCSFGGLGDNQPVSATRSVLVNILRVLPATCIIVGAAAACSRASSSTDDHIAHMSAADAAAPSASGGAGQGTAGLPASNTKAAERVKASPRHGEWVKVAWEPGSSDSLMAWIVYPSTSRTKSPVVVVVHEIFGLSTWVRGVADQVAADGFIAIAPDLNSRVRGGPSTEELSGDSARRLIQGVNASERNRGIIAVARYAMSQPSASQKYGVIGYCWGGSTVFMHAVNGGTAGFAGGVAFYGGFPYMNGPVPIADSRCEDQGAGDAAQRLEGRADRGRDAGNRLGDEGVRQDLQRPELRGGGARVPSCAGRSESDTRSGRGSGERGRDEGRMAEDSCVSQATSEVSVAANGQRPGKTASEPNLASCRLIGRWPLAARYPLHGEDVVRRL